MSKHIFKVGDNVTHLAPYRKVKVVGVSRGWVRVRWPEGTKTYETDMEFSVRPGELKR